MEGKAYISISGEGRTKVSLSFVYFCKCAFYSLKLIDIIQMNVNKKFFSFSFLRIFVVDIYEVGKCHVTDNLSVARSIRTFI